MPALRQRLTRPLLLGFLIVVALPAGAATRLSAASQQALTVEDLRAGGYVIFFRHALSAEGVDADPVTPEDCSTQRNMSPQGLRDAREIGQAFSMLQIPVEQVLSSEFCRALETARIAFGRAQLAPRLNLCCADQRPLTQEQRFSYMEAAIVTPPPDGLNTVLVGHGQGLATALEQGEAGIYRPDGLGGYLWVARVKPSEWMLGVYPPGAP